MKKQRSPHRISCAFTAVGVGCALISVTSLTAGEDAPSLDTGDERYRALYESVMVRQGSDGKSYGLEELDPLLWNGTRFLREGPSHERFLTALEAFNAQSEAAFASYRPMQRAVLQRLLWAVFDWAAQRGTGRSEGQRTIQRRVVPVLKRLALSRRAIEQLPDTFEATVNAARYEAEPSADNPFQPFFPATLFEAGGPWVRLASHSLTAKTHAEDGRYRSAFSVFARLPGGRASAVRYFDELSRFRDHWVPTPPGQAAVHPRTRVSPNSQTPQFPPGTQFALVRQALLIDATGDLVVSPLVEKVQIRAYVSLSSQAVAEFSLKPLRAVAGDFTLHAALPDVAGFHLFVHRRAGDPFLPGAGLISHGQPPWQKGGLSPLKNCTTCHSGRGIHSVASRTELFNMTATAAFRGSPSQVPPALKPAEPEVTWKETMAGKRATYEWGLLEGSW